MAYPIIDEIPQVPLTEREEDHLRLWIDEQLRYAEADRKGFIDDLMTEIDIYEAIPPPYKDFPWENSSNLTIPVAASMADTIFPRIYSTVFGVDPVFTCEDVNPFLAKHVKAYQKLLDLIQEKELKLRTRSRDWFMESVIHGTSVVKLIHETIRVSNYKNYQPDDDGEMQLVDDQVKTKKNGPALYHVPLEDFYIPFRAKSIEDAEWVAHRIRTTWGSLKIKEDMGLYENLDRIEASSEWRSPDYEAHRESLENREISWQEEFEIFEVWCEYDYDEDGLDESLVVTYHMPTQTLLRVQFNPYWHGRKPFREFVYWPRHDRFYGIGIAHMAKPHQDEISTLHNQNIDNRTVANTRMWEVVAGSRADQHFSGVAPSKKVKVDKLGEEIQPLQLGEVYRSSSESETMALRYAQQRTGVSDFLSGVDLGGEGGRVTATTTMARMQEARTRFNWTLDSAREAMSDIAIMTTQILQQFFEEDDPLLLQLGDEDAELVAEFLSMEPDEVERMYNITVTASSASLNKEVEKQNLIGLVQLLGQYTQTFEQPYVMLLMNPQTPPPMKEYAMEKLQGARTLFNRILQTFDVRNTDDVLGSLEPLAAALEGPEGGAGLGGAGIAGPPSPFGGMGAMGPAGVGAMGAGGP